MSLNRYIKLIFGDELEKRKRVRALPPEDTEWFKLIQRNQEERRLKNERKRAHYAAKRARELDLYRRCMVTDED